MQCEPCANISRLKANLHMYITHANTNWKANSRFLLMQKIGNSCEYKEKTRYLVCSNQYGGSESEDPYNDSGSEDPVHFSVSQEPFWFFAGSEDLFHFAGSENIYKFAGSEPCWILWIKMKIWIWILIKTFRIRPTESFKKNV